MNAIIRNPHKRIGVIPKTFNIDLGVSSQNFWRDVLFPNQFDSIFTKLILNICLILRFNHFSYDYS